VDGPEKGSKPQALQDLTVDNTREEITGRPRGSARGTSLGKKSKKVETKKAQTVRSFQTEEKAEEGRGTPWV